MANLDDLLNAVVDSDTNALSVAADFIGTLADLSGAGAFLSAVLMFTGQQPDPVTAALQALQNAIETDFQQLTQQLNAQQILDRNTNLTNQLGPALAQLQGLQEFAGGNPSRAQASSYINICITALDTLGPGVQPNLNWETTLGWWPYWTDFGQYSCDCPTIGGTVYTSQDAGYGAQQPSPNPDGTVFLYIYVLPVYLQAIGIFLAVAGALDPNFATDYANVLRPSASFLQSIHDKILQSGLTQLSPPAISGNSSFYQIACGNYPGPPGPGVRLFYVQTGKEVNQTGAAIEYGAVEKFSGFNSIDDIYRFLGDGYTVAVFNKLQIRLMMRAKEVYVGVGLQRVWQVINQLKGLIGDPPLPRPCFADWSLRKVFALAGVNSLRALATFMVQTPPPDTPYPSPSANISVRTLLTQSLHDYPIPAGSTSA